MHDSLPQGGRAIDAAFPLINKLHIVPAVAQYERLLQELAQPSRPTVVSFLNQHAFNLSLKDAVFRDVLLGSDVLLRDGVGMAWCLRKLDVAPGLNMNGTDLIPAILKTYAGRRAVVLGTTRVYAEQAAQKLRETGLIVENVLDGFADDAAYLSAVVAARPDVVLLGMGMPKQERIAAQLAKSLAYPVLIINGGAILDFLAGRFPRAPQWLRHMRLEWLYRLSREPQRLWQRYVTGGAVFVCRVLQMRRRLSAPDRPVLDTTHSHEDSHIHPSTVSAAGNYLNGSSSVTTSEQAAATRHAVGESGIFSDADANIANLVQRVEAALTVSGAGVVQFIAANSGAGVSSVASAYAKASSLLHKRKVLLLSNSMAQAACSSLVGCVLDGQSVKSDSMQLTQARLFSEQHSYQDNYAVLADETVWAALRAQFDQVIVDATEPYGLTVAPHASGVVVVVEAETTHASVLRNLLGDLAAIHAQVVGTVLNKRRLHVPPAIYDRF